MTDKGLWHQQTIRAALAGGATVVTASKRLARAVELAYAEEQVRAGRQAWERPRVLPWTAFLSEVLASLDQMAVMSDARPQLLNAVQAEALWEKVVRASGAGNGLLQPLAAARTAQEAWVLCHEYRLDPVGFASSGNSDAAQFSAWATEFCGHCHREHWLDGAELPERLANWITTGQVTVPKHLVFAGFDAWAPQQQQLVEALRASGCRCEVLTTEVRETSSAQRMSCADREHELRAAARWAGALLAQNPEARIGIVVQDLADCREPLLRALDENLCPSARFGADPPRPYNLSLGRPLADTPLVHDALRLLGAMRPMRVDFNTLSQIVRSPFVVGAESEMAARARLELKLRETGAEQGLGRVLEVARRQNSAPLLVEALQAVLKWRNAQTRHQLPSAWAQGFAELLRLYGWPGERTRDSREHQVIAAFRDLLGELAQLDAVSGTLSLAEAVARFTRLAAQSIFQPASEDVPVQVMGTLEASGLRFDHLWIAGWSDDNWPASPRPNPLIPVNVQRQHGLPHSGAQRELDFAQRLTALLLASAPEVIVSAAERDADQELRPSPLIAGLPQVKLEDSVQPSLPNAARYLFDHRPALEVLDDSRGPAVRQPRIHGGTGVLKSQSACAFQAFAQYRLGAERLNDPEPGLDARGRGSLVHAVLYRLFGELRDHQSLMALDEAQKEGLLTGCVNAELDRVHGRQPEIFTPQFVALERERLLRLMRGWLAVERERAPFSVAQREYARTVNVGPLQLNTRVDRLDRLAAGGYAIIDYKTGDAKPAAWQGERPDEPQLPCYAVTAQDPVTAVLFAVLRPGEVEYRGQARDPGIAAGVAGFGELKRLPDGCENWDALLAHWLSVLTHLAEEHAAGAAEVTPKDRNRTCRVCHLAPVCRIDEIQALGDADDD